MEKQAPFLIGAHTSAQGGVHNALYEGRDIGATTIQLFTSNQKRWEGKKIDEKMRELWFTALEETGISEVMSHDSYLINLGSCKAELLEKSKKAFYEELERCHALDLSFLNFHPGVATEATEQQCLDTIVSSLLTFQSLAEKGRTRLLIETTAGQGTTVGYSFEHIGYLIDRLEGKLPIGVCIDTCHIFSAGYDLRTEDALEKTLHLFDTHIGLSHLYALHMNDSMKPFGARKDRHAGIGEGEIGMEGFAAIMRHPKLTAIPKYLETPGGPAAWIEEIKLLKKLAGTNA